MALCLCQKAPGKAQFRSEVFLGGVFGCLDGTGMGITLFCGYGQMIKGF